MKKLKKLKYVPKYDLSMIYNAKNARINPPFSWYTLIATWFYIGRIPIMPGTMGSLGCFPIYYFVVSHMDSANVMPMFWMFFIPLFFVGWYAVSKFEDNTATHDHKSVVIDEVLGMLLVFCLCFPQAYSLAKILHQFINIKPVYSCFLIVFVVFRYFDIRKPLFIGYVDKHLRNSLSVILDDLLAGAFTFVTIYVANLILGKFF